MKKQTCSHWCGYLMAALIGGLVVWGIEPKTEIIRLNTFGNSCSEIIFKSGNKVVVVKGPFKGLIGTLDDTLPSFPKTWSISFDGSNRNTWVDEDEIRLFVN